MSHGVVCIAPYSGYYLGHIAQRVSAANFLSKAIQIRYGVSEVSLLSHCFVVCKKVLAFLTCIACCPKNQGQIVGLSVSKRVAQLVFLVAVLNYIGLASK